MIEIRKYNGKEQLAGAVYAVMASVYQPSPWTLEQIHTDMLEQVSQYYLAYKGQKLVGFLAVQTVLDQMEVTQLAVRPDFQRRGIAQRLLAALIDWEGDIFLEVRESNLAAQSLYTGQQFKEIGKRKNYYHNPREDAVIMKRSRDEG